MISIKAETGGDVIFNLTGGREQFGATEGDMCCKFAYVVGGARAW
jgi:hypothetical protein